MTCYTRKTLICDMNIPKGSERIDFHIKIEKERRPGESNVAGAILLSPEHFKFANAKLKCPTPFMAAGSDEHCEFVEA